MNSLLLYSYFWIFIIWIPFYIYSDDPNLPPSLQRNLNFLIKVSLYAAAYEVLMAIFFQNAIRIDIFLVLLILGLIYTASGSIIIYEGISKNYTNKTRLTSIFLGLVCFSVPVFSILGWNASMSESKNVDHLIKKGKQFRFEVAFRNDETQNRFYGQITSQTNPWAGYYLGDNTDSRFKHLIINEKGKFWIYNNDLWLLHNGQDIQASNSHKIEGVAIHAPYDKTNISLEHLEEDSYKFISERNISGKITDTSQQIIFKKASPPRFPVTASPNDEVKFIGVFSAKSPTQYKSYWITQIWLWQGNGTYWGQYLHDLYEKDRNYDFVATGKIKPKCIDDCKDMNITFETTAGIVSIRRKNENILLASIPGTGEEIILNRGEILPGFIFDLAPLTTSKQNQEWIEAITTGTFVKWIAE